jgi:hypothetical protein
VNDVERQLVAYLDRVLRGVALAAEDGGGWWNADTGPPHAPGESHRDVVARVIQAIEAGLSPGLTVPPDWLAREILRRSPTLLPDHVLWKDWLKEILAVCRDYRLLEGRLTDAPQGPAPPPKAPAQAAAPRPRPTGPVELPKLWYDGPGHGDY